MKTPEPPVISKPKVIAMYNEYLILFLFREEALITLPELMSIYFNPPYLF